MKKKTVSVRESFLGYIEMDGHDAESVAATIKTRMETDKLDLKNCRGQCYDNHSVMAGWKTGVQQRISQDYPLAYFINCDNHSLNLVGVKAVEQEPAMVTFFDTIQSFYVYFSASTQRWDQLIEIVKITLKMESDTRWS